MKLFAWTILAVGLVGCSGGAGDRDGRCGPTIAPGDYRCTGNRVEVCENMDNPDKNPPEWLIVQDCSALLETSRVLACTTLADGTTGCR